MLDSSLKVPEQLELTPGIVRILLLGLTPQQVAWKPAPERFSVAEVLAHLAHAEQFAYLPKYRAFAQEETPALAAYDTDGLISGGEYTNKDAGESIAAFARLRTENLTLLRSLPAEYGHRAGNHSRVGPIRLCELLNECAYHDLGHIRQIAELVRAQRYYPEMGLYKKYYKVNP